MNKNGNYDFTAQITDMDTGIVTIPDYECELSCSILRDEVTVDDVFIRSNNGDLINLNKSTDLFTQALVTIITTQAECDDDFLNLVWEDYEEAA